MRRGPGLVRTAAVAGTAAVTVNAVNNHAQRKAQEQAQNEANQQYVDQQMAAQQQQPQYAPAAGGGMSDEAIQQIGKLADLRASGALTEEEFQAAKAKLLA
jgi:hypothetical protein